MGKRAGTWVDYFHELLFSLNIGFAVAILLRVYVMRFPTGRSRLADLSFRMIFWINRFLGLRPQEYNQVGVELTFLFAIIAVSLIVLVVLRIAPETVRFKTLRAVGIFAALVAVPTSILCAYVAEDAEMVWNNNPLIIYNLCWLGMETCATVACLVLYFWRRRPVPGWATLFLLAVHYSLWGRVVLHLFSPASWAFALSLLPPCSALAWILFVRRERLSLAAGNQGE